MGQQNVIVAPPVAHNGSLRNLNLSKTDVVSSVRKENGACKYVQTRGIAEWGPLCKRNTVRMPYYGAYRTEHSTGTARSTIWLRHRRSDM